MNKKTYQTIRKPANEVFLKKPIAIATNNQTQLMCKPKAKFNSAQLNYLK